MTYADAMRLYGSDKPDLRFGLELVECTDYFKDTPFRVFQAPYVGAVEVNRGLFGDRGVRVGDRIELHLPVSQ